MIRAFLVLFLLLVGCATQSRQTRALLDAPPDVAPTRVLSQVQLVHAPEGYCGPAALAMASGLSDVTATKGMLMTGGRGTLPTDMLGATRRLGRLGVQLENLAQITREVDAGHPVIVFQNLGLSWWPRWHYAVVVGYDLPRQEMILHTGPQSFRREPMTFFERSWKLGGYWAVVTLPPDQLSASASEVAHLQGAVGLEQAGRDREALTAYRAILGRWPNSLGGLIGAGNVSYKQNMYSESVLFLRSAVKAHPGSVEARHNLDIAIKTDCASRRNSSDRQCAGSFL